MSDQLVWAPLRQEPRWVWGRAQTKPDLDIHRIPLAAMLWMDSGETGRLPVRKQLHNAAWTSCVHAGQWSDFGMRLKVHV